MQYFLIRLLPIIFLTTLSYGQLKELAKFDKESINATEFANRFELTPRIRSSADVDTQKTHFFLTLLAEKLWAKEARELNMDTTQIYQHYILNLEKMLVRDELFKKEVLANIKISDAEIKDALDKKSYNLGFRFLFSQSKSEIDSIYSRLNSNNIDSLLAGRQEQKDQAEPISVEFGQMDEQIEAALFNLKIGEFTKPIEQKIGWVIYFLVSKKKVLLTELETKQSILSEVKETIDTRKRKRLMDEYLDSILTKVKVDADGKLFNILAGKLFYLVEKRYENTDVKPYILYEDDLLKLISSFETEFKSGDFIKFPVNPTSLNEFLYYLYFNNFSTTGKDLKAVKVSLSGAVKDFIRYEIISREGYKHRLNEIDEIKTELKMWSDNFLSQHYRNTFNSAAKVSESGLNKYVSELKDTNIATSYVSITQVKLENLTQAQYLFSQLQFNYDFDEILSQMEINASAVYRSEDLEPLNSFGDLSSIIEKMSTGEVYGPIVGAHGYSVIKLNKKEVRTMTDEEKNKLQIATHKETLFYKNLADLLNNETIRLAKKYNLKVDLSLLKNITVTGIPTFIYKHYGFGGQTAAAPFLNLFYEWYEKYLSREKEAL